MIDELLESVKQIRINAKSIREKANSEPDERQRAETYAAAAAHFQIAIDKLERGLRALRRQEQEYTPNVCRVLEQLSLTYGSLGGTWRDARQLPKAIEQYDKGNDYEEERRKRCNAHDSYNLLQRLIVRLLDDPNCLHRPDFIQKLHDAREQIDEQLKYRSGDSWALADVVVVRILCGIDASDKIEEIEKQGPSASFYASTYKAVADLAEKGLGKGEIQSRLVAFKQFLQRHAGIV